MSRQLDQNDTPYAKALVEHRDRGGLRFMIPGHAAGQAGGSDRLRDFLGTQALELDIPQLVEGIDLGNDNAMDRARDLAAAAWGARTTWFLTNGASQGNRMAMQAVRALGQRVLVQRSCHSSVYDGLVMSGAVPEYLHPETDWEHGVAHGVSADDAERALVQAATLGDPFAALVVVSPSYYGVVADIPAIAASCRAHGAALVVDGSWGAHFGFHEDLPESPTRQGADIVLSSIHKLGGSLTQTAMLHLCETPYADALESSLEAAYRLTESTSLNSLLLASLDIARAELATGHGPMSSAIATAEDLRRAVSRAPGLRLSESDFLSSPGAIAIDPLHVSIDVRGRGVTGPQVKDRLTDADPPVFVEIAAPTTIVALIGPRGTPDVTGLLNAIDRVAPPRNKSNSGIPARDDPQQHAISIAPPPPGAAVVTPRDAVLAPSESVLATESVGRVAATLLSAYPPGIPNIVPGERITAELLDYLTRIAQLPGCYVRGAEDLTLTQVRVLREY